MCGVNWWPVIHRLGDWTTGIIYHTSQRKGEEKGCKRAGKRERGEKKGGGE